MIKLEDDIRLLRRSLAKGFISSENVKSKLDALEDVADRGEWIDLEDAEEENAEEEAGQPDA